MTYIWPVFVHSCVEMCGRALCSVLGVGVTIYSDTFSTPMHASLLQLLSARALQHGAPK